MRKYAKLVVFVACLLPLIGLIWKGFHDDLGANPVEKITHITGDWTLRFLLITLAVTPFRKIFGWGFINRFRRMLGLYAFFYASLHFLTYLVFDQFFDVQEIIKDIVKRPYITVGFTAFLMLLPLAATSSNNMVRRLGKRWKQLHQLVYVVAVCGVLHFLWLVKADILKPMIYAVLLLLLLLVRIWYQRKSPKTAVKLKKSPMQISH